MGSAQEWEGTRRRLYFGQRLFGTVTRVPDPGAIGVFVDIGLPVGGFVDVLLLPRNTARWLAEGTETEFEVWWADERPQVRLKPVEPRFVREDFTEWISQWRPGWPQEHGLPVTAVDALPMEPDTTG
jgi:predicted RNA-binding protein (virulence factor B family)